MTQQRRIDEKARIVARNMAWQLLRLRYGEYEHSAAVYDCDKIIEAYEAAKSADQPDELPSRAELRDTLREVKTWAPNEPTKPHVDRIVALLEDALTPKRESGSLAALEKIARAAESNSPDAHYLGNVAREALGLAQLPKKEPRV